MNIAPTHMKKNAIPNTLTLANLSCGFLAIYFVGQPMLAILFILAGAIFDVLDGLVARWLQATSSLGKDLDSLSDLVTFGIAPALLYSQIFSTASFYTLAPPIFLVVGSALRLAMFNQQAPEDHFKGLPTPANALSIVGLLYAFYSNSFYAIGFLTIPMVFFSIPLANALLMVSNWRFFSLKSLQNQKADSLGLLLCLLSGLGAGVALGWENSLWLGMVAYLVYNVLSHTLQANRA
jgi:CDP-diacylglycerol---serine O-phosphatidyltransferase